VSSLLVFDPTIDSPVETIKRALSRALARYRPVAGRLDGHGGIACTDEGVTFVGASANSSLEDAAVEEMDLAILYPGLVCRNDEPLLLLQVTEFSCGGFVVGVTANHVLADGAGMAQFLHAVAEFARGMTQPSCSLPVPVRSWDDDSFRGLRLPAPTSAAQKSRIENEPPRLARLDIVVPSRLISRIRADEPCTVLDAVMAVLWRCRTRAAMAPGAAAAESPAALKFVCNMRSYVGAPPRYYGNCIRAQVVLATVGAVADGCIGDLVRLIRRAKEKIPDLLSCGDKNGGRGEGREADRAAPGWYEGFSVTDWRYLGLDAIDLGGGVPARVLWHIKGIMEPGCVVCSPRRAAGRDGGGVDVSSMFLKPEHVDAFLAELARMAASAE
jgi:hypothetical protein